MGKKPLLATDTAMQTFYEQTLDDRERKFFLSHFRCWSLGKKKKEKEKKKKQQQVFTYKRTIKVALLCKQTRKQLNENVMKRHFEASRKNKILFCGFLLGLMDFRCVFSEWMQDILQHSMLTGAFFTHTHTERVRVCVWVCVLMKDFIIKL